jgi:hypothetical protein
MKLTSILKEIKISPALNKRKAFEDMLNLDETMLTYLIQHDTLDEFIEGDIYDSLEDLLVDDFGIDNPAEYITKITNYYNAIKPGDIMIIGESLTPIVDYRNAIVLVTDESEYFIATKF